jgi:dynein heavy chain
LIAILSDFYTADIVEDAYRFSPSGKFFAPPRGASSVQETLDFLKEQIPLHVDPELFGLHENANISCALAETNALLEARTRTRTRTRTRSRTRARTRTRTRTLTRTRTRTRTL